MVESVFQVISILLADCHIVRDCHIVKNCHIVKKVLRGFSGFLGKGVFDDCAEIFGGCVAVFAGYVVVFGCVDQEKG
jgi:hypothetical protein